MSANLLQTMLAEDNLYAAWQKVRDNNGAPGVDGISIASFGEKLLGRLITLKSDIERQQYTPLPLLEVWVPKDNGKLRRLAIPGGCKNFCVNGPLAGNCNIARSDDDRSEESRTQGIAGQPVG